LIVEDDPGLQSQLRWSFEDFDVAVAEDRAGALAQLPCEQRQVIVLHVLGCLRFREIARQSDESINTIQSRYRYGLTKLQSLLNGEVE